MKQEQSDLRGELESAQEVIANAMHQQKTLGERAKLLAEMEKRGVTDDEAYELRGKVTEMIRAAHCQLKRVDLGTATRRKWRTEDDPLEIRAGAKAGEDTPYTLRIQQLSLTIAGESGNIKKLLASIHGADKLIHTQRFSLKPIRGGLAAQAENAKAELVLELELTLFNLELEKKESDKKA